MHSHFKNWIDSVGGIPTAAKLLKVTEHTVRVWLRGESTPRSRTLKEIIRLSKGSLSFEVIYKETSKSKKA